MEAENLREAVRFALSGEEENLPSKFRIEEDSIEVYDRQNIGPHGKVNHYPVFERLFNPEDGYLKNLDKEMNFAVSRYVRIPKVWDSEVEKREIGCIGSDKIQEIQRRAVEESFAEGYSLDRFRELYDEVIN